MEIQYYGANAVRITTKKSNLLTDPVSDIADFQVDTKKAELIAVTQDALRPSEREGLFIVDRPGEYEFHDLSMKGIAAQPHTGTTGDSSATVYRVSNSDCSVLITGHINSKLSEDQLEKIGTIDVLIIPVGGGGYTMDAVEAANLVRMIEPKLVIPVHSDDDKLKYEVPQQELELFIKELGAVAEEPTDKLKIKVLPEVLTVQPLIKQ